MSSSTPSESVEGTNGEAQCDSSENVPSPDKTLSTTESSECKKTKATPDVESSMKADSPSPQKQAKLLASSTKCSEPSSSNDENSPKASPDVESSMKADSPPPRKRAKLLASSTKCSEPSSSNNQKSPEAEPQKVEQESQSDLSGPMATEDKMPKPSDSISVQSDSPQDSSPEVYSMSSKYEPPVYTRLRYDWHFKPGETSETKNNSSSLMELLNADAKYVLNYWMEGMWNSRSDIPQFEIALLCNGQNRWWFRTTIDLLDQHGREYKSVSYNDNLHQRVSTHHVAKSVFQHAVHFNPISLNDIFHILDETGSIWLRIRAVLVASDHDIVDEMAFLETLDLDGPVEQVEIELSEESKPRSVRRMPQINTMLMDAQLQQMQLEQGEQNEAIMLPSSEAESELTVHAECFGHNFTRKWKLEIATVPRDGVSSKELETFQTDNDTDPANLVKYWLSVKWLLKDNNPGLKVDELLVSLFFKAQHHWWTKARLRLMHFNGTPFVTLQQEDSIEKCVSNMKEEGIFCVDFLPISLHDIDDVLCDGMIELDIKVIMVYHAPDDVKKCEELDLLEKLNYDDPIVYYKPSEFSEALTREAGALALLEMSNSEANVETLLTLPQEQLEHEIGDETVWDRFFFDWNLEPGEPRHKHPELRSPRQTTEKDQINEIHVVRYWLEAKWIQLDGKWFLQLELVSHADHPWWLRASLALFDSEGICRVYDTHCDTLMKRASNFELLRTTFRTTMEFDPIPEPHIKMMLDDKGAINIHCKAVVVSNSDEPRFKPGELHLLESMAWNGPPIILPQPYAQAPKRKFDEIEIGSDIENENECIINEEEDEEKFEEEVDEEEEEDDDEELYEESSEADDEEMEEEEDEDESSIEGDEEEDEEFSLTEPKKAKSSAKWKPDITHLTYAWKIKPGEPVNSKLLESPQQNNHAYIGYDMKDSICYKIQGQWKHLKHCTQPQFAVSLVVRARHPWWVKARLILHDSNGVPRITYPVYEPSFEDQAKIKEGLRPSVEYRVEFESIPYLILKHMDCGMDETLTFVIQALFVDKRQSFTEYERRVFLLENFIGDVDLPDPFQERELQLLDEWHDGERGDVTITLEDLSTIQARASVIRTHMPRFSTYLFDTEDQTIWANFPPATYRAVLFYCYYDSIPLGMTESALTLLKEAAIFLGISRLEAMVNEMLSPSSSSSATPILPPRPEPSFD